MIDFSGSELEHFAALDDETTQKICPGGCGGLCDVNLPHCLTCDESDVEDELGRREWAALHRIEWAFDRGPDEEPVAFLERVAAENAEISRARCALSPRSDEFEDTWPDEPTVYEKENAR